MGRLVENAQMRVGRVSAAPVPSTVHRDPERRSASTPRIRVLIIEPSGLLWGSERALIDLAAHLDTATHDVTVLCPRRSLLEPRIERYAKVITGPVGDLHLRGQVPRLRALWYLTWLLLRTRPDVVHLNQAGLVRIVRAACRIARVPFVCHVRLFEDAARIRSRYSAKSAADCLIAISRSVFAELTGNEPRASDESQAELAGARSRTQLIYDPFDIEAFRGSMRADARESTRAALGIPEESKVVTLVGRLCEEKGQKLLLRAAEQLRDGRYCFLFVGGEPATGTSSRSYRSELEALAEELSITEQVRFLGSRDDVADLLAASDVTVMASGREPFGRVILEAIALHVPVIASRAGGAEEIIGADERGLTFTPGDARALGDAITATFNEPMSAAQRAERAAAWVAFRCSPSRHATAIAGVYRTLVAARAPAA